MAAYSPDYSQIAVEGSLTTMPLIPIYVTAAIVLIIVVSIIIIIVYYIPSLISNCSLLFLLMTNILSYIETIR